MEKGEKQVLEESAFEEMERDFQGVLNELSGDKSLEKFRIEYERLHAVMKKSYDNEKRLMAKCRELNAEIVVNSAKVVTALKLSQDDQTTIASLKKEIEKAWKMVDSAYDKEQKAKETILALKEEIVNLTKLVEQGSGLSMDQDSNIRDLLKFKEEVTKERDQLLSEVVKLRESLAQTTEQQQETERSKEEAEHTISQFQQEIQQRQNEASREFRKKEKLEKELKQIQTDMDSRQTEIKALQQYVQKSKEELQKLEQQLKEQKILNERAAKELEQFQMRNAKLQQENEQHSLVCEQLSQENQQKALELKVNTKEQIHKKLHHIEDQKAEVEQHKETLKNQIVGLEREVEASKKQAELDRKAMDELLRERDILNKNMLKAVNATQKQTDLVKLHEQAKRNLEEEIQNYKDEAQKQRKIIFHLEKERDRYINQASDLTQKVLMNMEDIKVRETQIFDYRKKIAESEIKLKQQQNLYEAVRSDRNLYSKNLVEAQDEITEMKRKLKIMTHQVDQLKEEISAKESALEKEKLYMELKYVLARQPGPEAAEQLKLYRRTLHDKKQQLKVLSSELNMYEVQSQEYKYEVEKLTNELQNLKKKYLAQKRKEQLQKNKDTAPMDNTFLMVKPNGPGFTGGGFPLKSTKMKF
uniref:Cilia and flagella associated protein 58 n=1 Tax=Mandrillus leucophaeus TaxID=9568 RepID=A0A2K5ZQI4_MANLE